MNLFSSIGVILNLSLIIGQLNAESQLLTADNIKRRHIGIGEIGAPNTDKRVEDFWTTISDAPTYRAKDIKVLAGGLIRRGISEKDLHAFNLTEETVRTAVALDLGKYPDKPLYFSDPTPWGNLFDESFVKSSEFNLRLSDFKVSQYTDDEIMLSEKCENLSDKPLKCFTNGNYENENVLTMNWSETYGIEMESPMKMNVVIASSQVNFDFDYEWGVNVTKTNSTMHTSLAFAGVELQPHDSVTWTIKAKRTILKADFIYEANLIDYVLATDHVNHTRIFVGLNDVLQFKDTQNCEKIGLNVEDCETVKKSFKKTVQITQTVEVVFFTDDSIIVSSP